MNIHFGFLNSTVSSFTLLLVGSAFALATSGCQPKKSEPPAEVKNTRVPFAPKKPKVSEDQQEKLNAKVIEFFDKADKVDLGLKMQCANEICGDPKTAQTIGTLKKDTAKSVPAEIEATFIENIKSLYQLKLETLKVQNDIIKQKIEQLPNYELAGAERIAFNIFWLFFNFDTAKKAVKDASDKKSYEVDSQTLKSELPDLNAEDIKHLQKFLENFVNSDHFKEGKVISSIGFADYLKLRYENVKPETALSIFVERSINAIKKIKQAIPDLNYEVSEDLKLAQSEKAINLALAKNADQYIYLDFIAQNLEDSSSLFADRNISSSSLIAYYKPKLDIQSIEEVLNDPRIQNENLEKSIQKCAQHLNFIGKFAPTKNQISSFQNLVPEIVGATYKFGSSLTTDQNLLTTMKTHLNSVEFRYPETREEILSSIAIRIKK